MATEKLLEAVERLAEAQERVAEAAERGAELAERLAEMRERMTLLGRTVEGLSQSSMRAAEGERGVVRLLEAQQLLARSGRITKALETGANVYSKVVPATGELLVKAPKIALSVGVVYAGYRGYNWIMEQGKKLRTDEKLSNPIITYQGKQYLAIPITADEPPKLQFFWGAPPADDKRPAFKLSGETDSKSRSVMTALLPVGLTIENEGDAIAKLMGQDGDRKDQLLVVRSGLTPDAFMADARDRYALTVAKAQEDAVKRDFFATLDRLREGHEIRTSTSNTIEPSGLQKYAKYLPWLGVAAGALISTVMPLVGIPLAIASYCFKDKIVEAIAPGATSDTIVMQRPGGSGTPTAKADDKNPRTVTLRDGGEDMEDVLKGARDAVAVNLKGFQVDCTGVGALFPKLSENKKQGIEV